MSAASNEMERQRLQQRVVSSANWFYWIAGLSAVNSVVVHTGSAWSFVAGLGITQVFDAIGRQAGSTATVMAVILDAFAAGLFVLLGYLARSHRAAFALGIVLYAVDGMIFVLVREPIGILFHAFVLYCIVMGFLASGKLSRLPRVPAEGSPVAGPARQPFPGPLNPA